MSPQVLTGSYEPHVYAFLTNCVRAGDFVVEIGCNVGFHTVRIAELVGIGGRVLGFEPNPTSRSVLLDNLIVCGLRNRVTIRSEAVGDRDCTVAFHALRDEPAGSYVVRDGAPNWADSLPGEQIEVVMVDVARELRALDRRPDLIKVDVEGNEIPILESLISSDSPVHSGTVILAEILGSTAVADRDRFDELIGAMVASGLGIHRIGDHGGLEQVDARAIAAHPWADYVICNSNVLGALKDEADQPTV